METQFGNSTKFLPERLNDSTQAITKIYFRKSSFMSDYSGKLYQRLKVLQKM